MVFIHFSIMEEIVTPIVIVVDVVVTIQLVLILT